MECKKAGLGDWKTELRLQFADVGVLNYLKDNFILKFYFLILSLVLRLIYLSYSSSSFFKRIDIAWITSFWSSSGSWRKRSKSWRSLFFRPSSGPTSWPRTQAKLTPSLSASLIAEFFPIVPLKNQLLTDWEVTPQILARSAFERWLLSIISLSLWTCWFSANLVFFS